MLEERGVFFSYPMDLDFAMLLAYPEAYNVEEEKPDNATIKAVLERVITIHLSTGMMN